MDEKSHSYILYYIVPFLIGAHIVHFYFSYHYMEQELHKYRKLKKDRTEVLLVVESKSESKGQFLFTLQNSCGV